MDSGNAEVLKGEEDLQWIGWCLFWDSIGTDALV